MKVIDLYIAKQVLLATALVMLVLISLDALFSMIRELQRGDVLRAVLLVLWELPLSVYKMMPVAVLLGAVLGLGTLAAQNELTAVRTAGASVWRVFISVLHAGIPLALLLVLMGEFVVPLAANKVQQVKLGVSSSSLTQRSDGFWAREGDNYVRVGSVVGDQILRGVSVFETDGRRILRVTHAKRAVRNEKNVWRLISVNDVTPQASRLDVGKSPTREIDQLVDTDFIKTLSQDMRWMSVGGLLSNIAYLRDNGVNVTVEEHALWQKLVTPFTVIVMLLLAVPMVFGSSRDGNAGQRIFVASLVGLGFMLLNNVTVSMGQLMGYHASINTLAAVILFAVIAFWLLRKQDT
ncbi:MAG: LPS export ABC transporter permease LptG [Granulosicoccaceae bacterium]